MAIFPPSHVRSKPVAIRYVLAVLAAAAALLLRHVVSPLVKDHVPYVTVWPSLVFCSLYLGIGPSLLTALIGLAGVWYWFLPPSHSFALQDPRSQLSGVVAFFVLSAFAILLGEITGRSKETFERSEFRFNRLIQSNIIPIACGVSERITEANDAFLELIGYSRDDLLAGKIDWMKMTPPEHVPKDMHALEQLKSRGCCTPYEKEYLHKDGGHVPIIVGGTVVNSSPLEWLAFVLDLSDLKRIEAELRKSQDELEQKVAERTQALTVSLATFKAEVVVRRKTEAQLRQLSARLLQLQDEERRHIARDLHDSTGQTLASLKLTLCSLAKLIANVPKAPDLLSDLEALADQAVLEIRTTSHLLHPPLLDEMGFSSAAQWYVDEFTKRSRIKASLEISSAPRLTKDGELVFFRVLQESLTNVLRHSGSEAVDIRLHSNDKDATLTIRDYGKGIPSEKVRSFHETGTAVGVGLGGMKQRVREFGGQLMVNSDDSGTCVTATLPLTKREQSAAEEGTANSKAAPAA